MPGLKEILRITPLETKAQKDFRANCIQTIGCIFDSVKDQPQICKDDALQVTQLLTDLLNSGKLEDSDPQIITMQGALPQLASCLKADFVPFLPDIMKSLLNDAKRDIDFKIVEVNAAELEEKDEDENDSPVQKMTIAVKGVEGSRQIQMNTSVLENKIMAIQVIKKIATSLGKLFFDHVEEVSQLVVTQLINDKYSSAIRKEATKLLHSLLMCTNDSEQMKVLINLYLPALGMQINTKVQSQDFRSVKWLMCELSRCFNQFYNFKGQFLS